MFLKENNLSKISEQLQFIVKQSMETVDMNTKRSKKNVIDENISIGDFNLSISKGKKQMNETSEPEKCIAFNNEKDKSHLTNKETDLVPHIYIIQDKPCEVKHKKHKKTKNRTTKELESCVLLNDNDKLKCHKNAINKCFSEGIVDSEKHMLTKHKKNKEMTRESQNVQLSKVDIINHDFSSDKRKKHKRKHKKVDTEAEKRTISSDDNEKLNASLHKKQKNKCFENIGISIDDYNLLSVSKPKKHTKGTSKSAECIEYKNTDKAICKLVKKDTHNDIFIINQDNNPCEVTRETYKKKHKNTTKELEDCIILNDNEKLDGFKHNKKVANESILEDMRISKSMSDLTKLKTNMEMPNFQVSKICTVDDLSIGRKKHKKMQKNRDREKEENRTFSDGNKNLDASKHNKKQNNSECISENRDISESMFVLTKHKEVNKELPNLQVSKVGMIEDISSDKKKKHKKRHKNRDKEKGGKLLYNNENYSNSNENTIDKECATVVDGKDFRYIISKKQKHLKESDCIILTDDGKSSHLNCSKIDKNEEIAINEENVSADNDLGDKRKKHKKKHRKTDADEYVTNRELNVINLEESVKHNDKNRSRKSDDGRVDNFLINKKQKHLKESDYIILTDDGKSSDINCSKIDKNEEFAINEENVSADNDLGDKRKKHKKKQRKTDLDEYVTDRELNVINLKKSMKHNDKNRSRKSDDGCVDNLVLLHNSENEIVESVMDLNNVSSVQKKRKRTDSSVRTSNRLEKHIHVDYTESNNEANCESLQEVAITVSNEKSKKNSISKTLKHNMGVKNIVDFPPIDFPISPLHEKNQVHCLSAEEKKKLISMGIKIQTGRFTKNEDSILLKNWQDFVKKVGNDDPNMLLGIGQGVGRKSWKPCGIYLHLTRGLGNRTLYSIYRRARDLLHPNKKCKQLTAKNISNIKKLKLRHGNHWVKIGEHVGISGRTCETSYRSCNEQVMQGKFTEEEDQMLIKAVKKVMEEQGKKLTGESVNTEGIPWETVASLIPTRNVFQCRQRWILYLSCNLYPEKRCKWSKREMAKVICLLKKNMVEDETLIDWRELNSTFFADFSPSYLYIMKKWYHKKYTVPKSENVNHASIVNYLYSTYVPKVLKSLRLREEDLFHPRQIL